MSFFEGLSSVLNASGAGFMFIMGVGSIYYCTYRYFVNLKGKFYVLFPVLKLKNAQILKRTDFPHFQYSTFVS